MSVESIYTRVIAQGDGANTKFGFQWKFIDESDIVVYVDDALIPSSEYSLEYPITKTSGSVVFNTAPAVGAIVVIKRAVNEQQSRMFKNTAQFNANEVEKAFDKLTMLVQEQLEGIRRQALTLASQSNVDWKVENLTEDDVLLAVDFDAKKLIQTSFTQEEVQAVIDEAVRSMGYTVKNIEWNGSKAVFTFSNGVMTNSITSPNVAQLRVVQNENGDYFLQWSLDGIHWNSSGAGVSIHNDLTEREAANAHPIAAITALQTAIEWLGARSSVFEIMPTLAPLNREVYGQKIYTNAYPSDFTRIPVKTFQENDAELDDVIIGFSQFLRVGSYVVDENGTIGVVENFNGDNTLYRSITITTLSPGYAREIVALNTNAALKTTDFETPITASNKGATMKEIEDLKTTSLIFIGYVSATAPTGLQFEVGDLWFEMSSLPTTFPIPASSIYTWTGSQWSPSLEDFTPLNFDFISDLNSKEGYYWFGGEWKVMSTDLSTDYFQLNQQSGLWEIKPSVNLPGTPTVDTPTVASDGRQIANKDYVDGLAGGTGRNVGDIFFTSRTDAALAGAVVCDGSVYNVSDFGGTHAPGTLLAQGKLPSVDLDTYQDYVDNFGSCRAFGWDGGDQFRVPLLNDVFIEAGHAQGQGEFLEAGLPNIEGTFASLYVIARTNGGDSTGAISSPHSTTSTYYGNINADNQWGHGFDFDASRSNSMYGKSTTVQPPAVRYRAFVQLFTQVADESIVDTTELLANLADMDYVIHQQRPTADNNYTWYRLYKSGYVEQGGTGTGIKDATGGHFNLPIVMATSNYDVSLTIVLADEDPANYTVRGSATRTNATQLGFVCFLANSITANQPNIRWSVRGYSTQTQEALAAALENPDAGFINDYYTTNADYGFITS